MAIEDWLAKSSDTAKWRQNTKQFHACSIPAAANKTIFCHRTPDFFRAQFGLKFVGTSACRTVADFLSRPTVFRLAAESSKSRWHLFCENWQASPDKVVVHCTLANKAQQDVLRSRKLSDIAQQAPILSQTCLNSSHTSQQVKIFLSAHKKSASVWRPSLRLILFTYQAELWTSLLSEKKQKW